VGPIKARAWVLNVPIALVSLFSLVKCLQLSLYHGTKKLSITTISITTFSITTISITTFNITILSIMTFRILINRIFHSA
jgi:hypothetical protein